MGCGPSRGAASEVVSGLGKADLDERSLLRSPLACGYAAIYSLIKAVQRAQYSRRCLDNGECLPHGGPHPKVLPLLITGATKAGGRGTIFEATHRVITLFDATVILLNAVDEI